MSHKLTIEIVVPDGNGEPTTAVYVDGVELKYMTHVGFESVHDDFLEVSLSTITVHEDLPEEVNQTLAEQIDLMKAFEPYELCCETKHMDICDELKGHTGDHLSANGLRWC